MAVNPNPSKLDQTQIFQRAFDEGEERLRVDAEISASIGTIEVAIDAAAGDNIAISDGTDQLEINSDGSINVVVPVSGTPAIANLSMPTKNTEYSVSLPANSRQFILRARSGKLQLCFTSGQSNTNYLTIPKGSSFDIGDIKASSLTIYVRSDTSNDVVEVMSWA
jgi:hypothetical protein